MLGCSHVSFVSIYFVSLWFKWILSKRTTGYLPQTVWASNFFSISVFFFASMLFLCFVVYPFAHLLYSFFFISSQNFDSHSASTGPAWPLHVQPSGEEWITGSAGVSYSCPPFPPVVHCQVLQIQSICTARWNSIILPILISIPLNKWLLVQARPVLLR